MRAVREREKDRGERGCGRGGTRGNNVMGGGMTVQARGATDAHVSDIACSSENNTVLLFPTNRTII
jgi:hypothetical protein